MWVPLTLSKPLLPMNSVEASDAFTIRKFYFLPKSDRYFLTRNVIGTKKGGGEEKSRKQYNLVAKDKKVTRRP